MKELHLDRMTSNVTTTKPSKQSCNLYLKCTMYQYEFKHNSEFSCSLWWHL